MRKGASLPTISRFLQRVRKVGGCAVGQVSHPRNYRFRFVQRNDGGQSAPGPYWSLREGLARVMGSPRPIFISYERQVRARAALPSISPAWRPALKCSALHVCSSLGRNMFSLESRPTPKTSYFRTYLCRKVHRFTLHVPHDPATSRTWNAVVCTDVGGRWPVAIVPRHRRPA